MINTNNFLKKNSFLLILILLTILIYTMNFSLHTVTSDGSENLLLGKKLLEGQYTERFFHRMPLVPTVYSFFYLIGFGVEASRFIVPLIFMIVSILATFLFVREITNEKTAKISAGLLLVFPMFWRWGMTSLIDIPLLAISMFSFYFFYRALKDKRYFIPCGILCGLGMVTKVSFFILPFILILYLLVKRRAILKTREFWSGILLLLLIFFSFLGLIYSFTGEISLIQFQSVTQTATGQADTAITEIISGTGKSITYFLKLVLFPLIIFFPFGVFSLYKKKIRLPLIYFFVFLIVILFFWVVRLRYFSPLYPVLMLFVAQGFFWLRKRFNTRRVIDMVFAVLVVISFINSMYWVSSSEWYWGVDALADYTRGLDGKIASYYLPEYLNLTGSVITGKYNVRDFFHNFSYSMVKDNNVDYLILSVYSDYDRYLADTGKPAETYSSYFGLLERAYSGERPPPSYRFQSELYKELQIDSRFERIKEIYRGEQVIFIVYKVH